MSKTQEIATLDDLSTLTPKQLKRRLGRPTKYHSGMLVKAIEYLRTYQDKGQEIPTRAGLAQALEIDRETVTAWAEDPEKHEFSRLVRVLDQQQEIDLLNGGVTGSYNSKVVSMALTKHGYGESAQGGSKGVTVTVNVDRTCGGVTIEGEKIG